jgi:hypothetical protein
MYLCVRTGIHEDDGVIQLVTLGSLVHKIIRIFTHLCWTDDFAIEGFFFIIV